MTSEDTSTISEAKFPNTMLQETTDVEQQKDEYT